MNSRPASDDMGAFWRDVKAAGREKRAGNRDSSERLLREAGVPFESKNFGAHLIVRPASGMVVDFWPGTGRWTVRGGNATEFGVRKLLEWCKTTNAEPA